MDSIVPGEVPLHRLEFDARTAGDCARNLRVFANALKKLGIQKEARVASNARVVIVVVLKTSAFTGLGLLNPNILNIPKP